MTLSDDTDRRRRSGASDEVGGKHCPPTSVTVTHPDKCSICKDFRYKICHRKYCDYESKCDNSKCLIKQRPFIGGLLTQKVGSVYCYSGCRQRDRTAVEIIILT